MQWLWLRKALLKEEKRMIAVDKEIAQKKNLEDGSMLEERKHESSWIKEQQFLSWKINIWQTMQSGFLSTVLFLLTGSVIKHTLVGAQILGENFKVLLFVTVSTLGSLELPEKSHMFVEVQLRASERQTESFFLGLFRFIFIQRHEDVFSCFFQRGTSLLNSPTKACQAGQCIDKISAPSWILLQNEWVCVTRHSEELHISFAIWEN